MHASWGHDGLNMREAKINWFWQSVSEIQKKLALIREKRQLLQERLQERRESPKTSTTAHTSYNSIEKIAVFFQLHSEINQLVKQVQDDYQQLREVLYELSGKKDLTNVEQSSSESTQPLSSTPSPVRQTAFTDSTFGSPAPSNDASIGQAHGSLPSEDTFSGSVAQGVERYLRLVNNYKNNRAEIRRLQFSKIFRMGLYGVAVYNAAVLGFSVFTPFVPAIVAIGGGCLFGYAVHRLFYRYIKRVQENIMELNIENAHILENMGPVRKDLEKAEKQGNFMRLLPLSLLRKFINRNDRYVERALGRLPEIKNNTFSNPFKEKDEKIPERI